MKAPVRVTLTATEIMLANFVNDERNKHNRRTGAKCRKFSERCDIELHGMGAELAVARHLNLYPDLVLDEPGKMDDLRSHSGKIIDVKNCSSGFQIPEYYPERVRKSGIKIDVFVFTRGDIPNYEIFGWVEYDTLIVPGRLKKAKFNNSYQIADRELRSVNTFPLSGRGCVVHVCGGCQQ